MCEILTASHVITNHVIFHLPARQKEKALGSITEVVQTVKDPKSIMRSMNNDHDTATSKLHENQEKLNFDFVLPKSVESIGNTSSSTTTTGRQKTSLNFQGDNNMSRVSSYEERNNSSRKSGRVSFKRYLFISLNFI